MTELALLGGEGFSLERLRADEAAARPDRCSASVVEAQPSAASESEPSTSGSSDKHINGFIYHKVTKLDTLAGLAIKYRVTVSDIKRANGILSDNAMFAREHVKIPTGSMPMSEEAQVLLARLMSGYGRDASLNARERKAPGTVSITQLPGSPTSRSSNYCSSEAVDDDPGTPYSRRSDKSSEPGDVELMERSADGPHSGYGSDRVRRRTKNDSSSSSTGSRFVHSHINSQQLGQAAEAAVGWLSQAAAGAAAAAQAALPAAASSLSNPCLPPVARRSFNNAAFGGGGGGGGDSSTWEQLACAITQSGSSLITKIKRAASQPALAASQQQPLAGLGDVADALLLGTSRNGGGGSSNGSGSNAISGSSRRGNAGGGGGSGIDLLACGTGLCPPRKDTKGD